MRAPTGLRCTADDRAALPLSSRAFVCASTALLAAHAGAQTSLSVRAESDYRFRGVSLSDRSPAAHLNVAYDAPGGWYAGGAVSTVNLDREHRSAAVVGYAGYARRMATGASWEAGATAAHFTADSRYDYGELFAGFADRSWGVRLYYSPAYFGYSLRTAYVELNVGTALTSQLRVFGHVGLLNRLSGTTGWTASTRVRGDARVGLGWSWGAWELQLARVVSSADGPYPMYYGRDQGALVLSAIGTF